MARIDELIQQLCPDGVEYRSLGDMVEVRSGWGFPNAEQGVATGDYPFFKVGDMNLPGNEREMKAAQNYVSKETAARLKCKPAPKGTVIFPKIGAAIKTNKKRILSCEACYDNNVMGLVPASPELNQRFMYYVFVGVELYDLANDSGAVPSIRKGDVERHQIPVPPLGVQQEIVRILDAFTELEANLQRELDARKKQYEHYRDELVQQVELASVKHELLGDTCSEVTDFVAAGSFKMMKERVDYLDAPSYAQLIRTKDIKSGYSFADKVYVSKEAFDFLWRVNLNSEAIVLPNVGNCGEVYYIEPSKLPYEKCVLGPNAILVRSNSASVKYLYYLFQAPNFQNALHAITSPTGQRKFNKTELKKIPIAVPAIERQTEIVTKLDAMVALQDNLQRQIELTHKQYEHYRDQLLDLPRKVA